MVTTNSWWPTPFAVVDMFLAIVVLVSALGAIRPTLDVLAGRVESAEGPVQKARFETHGRSGVSFWYQIGNRLWPVSPEAARALVEGERYRIYYLPHAKSLVGIEPL